MSNRPRPTPIRSETRENGNRGATSVNWRVGWRRDTTPGNGARNRLIDQVPTVLDRIVF